MKLQIDIIPSYKVDALKWNNCIEQSSSPLIYASYIYLQNLCENWHAVIIDDYTTVMPVPWKKKFGIKYCYAVPFIQQLGWFSKMDNPTMNFMQILFSFCNYGDYFFNYGNHLNYKNEKLHSNYILDLSPEYKIIHEKYSGDFKRNILQASKHSFEYQAATIEEAIVVYKNFYKQQLKNVTNKDFQNFLSIAATLEKSNAAFARKIINQQNETLAIALFLRDEKRLYNLMNSTSPTGKKNGANHILLDNIVKEFAERNLLFDFEGSDIPGVEFFYKKTGANNQVYKSIHFNNLFRPLQLIKR